MSNVNLMRPANKAALQQVVIDATVYHGLRHGTISGPRLRRLLRRAKALEHLAKWQPAYAPRTIA
jgi:hypothetical protein